MKDYVDRGTAGAWKLVQDAQTAIKQEQEDMRTAEMVALTTREPEATFEEMLNTIGDSPSELASSNNEQDGEDRHEDEQDTG